MCFNSIDNIRGFSFQISLRFGIDSFFPDGVIIACKRGPCNENVTDFTVLAQNLEIEHIESETSNISQEKHDILLIN